MNLDDPRARAMIAEMLCVDIDRVTDDARLDADLDADSLDVVELVMRFEDEFGVEIPDDEAARVVTVADCLALLGRKLAAKAA